MNKKACVDKKIQNLNCPQITQIVADKEIKTHNFCVNLGDQREIKR